MDSMVTGKASSKTDITFIVVAPGFMNLQLSIIAASLNSEPSVAIKIFIADFSILWKYVRPRRSNTSLGRSSLGYLKKKSSVRALAHGHERSALLIFLWRMYYLEVEDNYEQECGFVDRS